MVCSRFSAWSNTMLASDSKTSPVTSRPSLHAGVLHHLLPDDGVRVMERRQAVHELDPRLTGALQQRGVHLVRLEQWDPLVPHVLRLAHRDPHIGVHEVHPGNGLADVVGDRDRGTGAGGDVLGDLDDIVGRRQRRWSGEAHVGAHQRTHHQQRSAHVEAAVTDERIGQGVVRLAARLVHRQEVGQHLRRVPLVGETVIDRHTGVRRQLLDVGLFVAAELDGVIHPARAPAPCPPPTPCGRAATRTGRGR